MGFFKKVGNGIAKGINKVAGTNFSVGSASENGDTSSIEGKFITVIENGVAKLVDSGLALGEKELNKQIEKLAGGNKSSGGGITETLGKFTSKIMDSATTEWLKKNWWLLLIPIPLAVIIYFIISGGKSKKKKWY